MTNREFYNAVIANEITDEVIAHATESRDKLDKANAAKSAKAAEKRAEKAIAEKPLYDAVEAMINEATKDAPVIASVVAEKLDISTSKATVILKSFVNAYVADVVEVKVKVTGKPSRVCKGYFKAV